jgi:thymidine phosphorylase
MLDKNKWINLIAEAQRCPLSDERIVEIISEYANSGEILSLTEHNTADVPSTGGPSSLSTLITPLFLVQAGFIVPKLGVPGRPAGGLDTLAQISGYKINMSENEIKNSISKCHYAHFISSGRYAPLDLDVFLLRKKNSALALPSLVIASILSKKIAVGIKNICLDIRIANHGNFGSNFTQGRLNAKQFIRISKILKLRSICFLTDANTPFQPYIGRGEALWALHNIFTENYCS